MMMELYPQDWGEFMADPLCDNCGHLYPPKAICFNCGYPGQSFVVDDDGILNLGDAEVVTDICRHEFDSSLSCYWLKVVMPC